VGYLHSIQKVLTQDFKGVSADEKDRAAKDVIEVCSFACAGLVLQPIPGLETAVLPIQAAMVLALAHVYGQEISKKRATEVVLDVAAITGASIVGRQALTTLAKVFLPGLGGVLTAPYTFSVTWGTGYAAIHYLRSGGQRPDRDKIRKIFEQEKSRSKDHYSDSKARENRPEDKDIPREPPG
jgi:uncharacterized protein (DUF697 family)